MKTGTDHVFLSVEKLDLYYGDAQALSDVSLEVGKGEIVAIVGANGAGTSSLIRCIAGIEAPRSGQISFNQKPISGLESHEICNLGIGQVAEGRQVFPSLTVHDKAAPDANYLKGLKLIEREASDDRNFVKKAVNWALRSIGKRNPSLNKAAIASAKRLAGSGDSTARWIGKDALREITSPAVQNRLARKRPQRA